MVVTGLGGFSQLGEEVCIWTRGFSRSGEWSTFSSLSFNLEEAINGQEGVAKVREHQSDLILTDLIMSMMDNFEATCQIRKLPGFEHILFIATPASVRSLYQLIKVLKSQVLGFLNLEGLGNLGF